jgi:hypothetical protein
VRSPTSTSPGCTFARSHSATVTSSAATHANAVERCIARTVSIRR